MSAAPNPVAPQLVTRKSRGTIVKVPDANPGLLLVNGSQKQFTLEGIWSSPVAPAPAPNQSVDVEFDDTSSIRRMAF